MAETFSEQVQEEAALQAQAGRVGTQIIATLVGGTLLICSLAARLLFDHEFYPAVLGLAAAVLLAAPLAVTAVKDLLQGRAMMNELVALAVLAAIAIGHYQEAAAIAFFMTLSVLIESRTALGAQASIESLVRITPRRACRIVNDREFQVNVKDLRPGDLVRVRPGDNIPADGAVTLGASTVNQASITGESLPVDKTVGDEVFGGTINMTGAMDIKVTKAGHDTTLGKVKQLILQAQRTRIPIMRMIDRYTAWYTPTVLMLVAIVLLLTLERELANPWERAIAMLVVACPFALILATPTAMVASLSSAARLGVLVKSVVDLEAARNLTAIIFDKTGTLTTGQLQVTRLVPAQGVDGAQLLRLAAAVEQHSKHPAAQAVMAVAGKAKLTLPETSEFQESPGLGVRATVNDEPVMVGRASWLIKNEISPLSPDSAAAIEQAQHNPETQGLSMLFVVQGQRLAGWIGLEDNTRPQAAAAIDALRKQGLKRLIIVTGDRQSVANRVAAAMHTEYAAEVLPHQKLELVDELKSRGHMVAVVGDGVNDAPALAAGDISIAMGAAGSDVAIHSAKIALMNNNLNRIPFLIDLSRKTSRVIKQNMFIGGGFIVVFLVLSAANLVTPVLAAVVQLSSGLVVAFNSARLVRTGEELESAEGGGPASPTKGRGGRAVGAEAGGGLSAVVAAPA